VSGSAAGSASTRAGRAIGVRSLTLEPLEFGATKTAFYQAVARASPRGEFPRAFIGEQNYWTVVGIDGGRGEALIEEDGRLETGQGRYSIEPFVWTRGRLI